MTTTDPTTIAFEQVRNALAALGIPGPVEDITRVEIDSERITVVRFRRDADGSILVAGNDAAKVTATIGVDWSGE